MVSRPTGQNSIVGLTLGHYRLVEKIGAGGMGEVYRARDEHLDREVAIKILPEGTLADEGARKRLRKEALSLSRLDHPNIATVHYFDSDGDIDYLVMEYIPGETLRSRIARAPLDTTEIAVLGTQIADGLAAAHERGLVHCDLKPENVRVTPDGRVKVLDFGVARLARPLSDLVSTSNSEHFGIAGTLPYMSPEQVLGKDLDARTDVYSFGVVLYEMGTGALPFRGNTPSAISDAILHDSPALPLRLNPALSPDLETIILKALEKDRDLRYQSAQEIGVDLKRLNRGSGHGTDTFGADGRSARRTREWMWTGAALVAALVGALWLGREARGPEPSEAAPVATVAPSIAVLPFADMSEGKGQEYFSDGLAEELIGRLSKIAGLRVAGRTSSFQFKGKNEDLRVIGQKLDVATILEGSVRMQGKRVRVTAQLINAGSGFHLWSETYDRRIDDIFAVQEEIARAVAGTMKLALLSSEGAGPVAETKNSEAYTDYLLGRYFMKRNSKEDMAKASDYYQQAIQLDPRYASAWVGLGDIRIRAADMAYAPIDRSYAEARKAVEQALTLNPNLAEAHVAMGHIQLVYDWDWTAADNSLKKALVLEPGNARVVANVAMLSSALGRMDDALSFGRKALELDPLSIGFYNNHGVYSYLAGRFDEAAASFSKALELNAEFPMVHTMFARLYLVQRRPREALAEIERESHPAWRLYGQALIYSALGRKAESDASLADLIAKFQAGAPFQIAEVFAFRGEIDRAFEWLERAYVQRDGGLTQISPNPLLKNLEGDPRYAAFVKKMRPAS